MFTMVCTIFALVYPVRTEVTGGGDVFNGSIHGCNVGGRNNGNDGEGLFRSILFIALMRHCAK